MIETLYHLAREDALVVGTSAALNVRAAYEVARSTRGRGCASSRSSATTAAATPRKVFNPEFLASKSLVPRPIPGIP